MLKLKILLLVCLMPCLLSARGKDPVNKEKAGDLLDSRQVSFLENAGQLTDADLKPVPFVLFKASVPGLDLYITKTGLSYVFTKEIKKDIPTRESNGLTADFSMASPDYSWERVDVTLKDANILRENIIKEDPEQGVNHYYLGHCPEGILNVKQYGRLTVRNIYPGIDWVLYNSGKTGFKYDFIVHPGADFSRIQLLYSSLSALNMGPDGSLELKNSSGSLTEQAPYSYLKENGEKVESHFTLLSSLKKESHHETLVGFDFMGSPRDNSRTLVIDPQLVWATALGGSSYERAMAIDHDLYDNVFVTGQTSSTNFPMQNAGTYFQGTFTSAPSNGTDIFITKFNASGVLIWSTYYGGNGGDAGYSITVDHLANVLVTGIAQSTDLPVQNAGGFFKGTYSGTSAGGQTDACILKFSNVGVRLWATYYGGNDGEISYSIKADKKGNVFVGGLTNSLNFQLLNAGTFFESAMTQGHSRGYILKFDAACNLVWSTLYGDTRVSSMTLDDSDNLFIAGYTHGNSQVKNPGGGAYFQPYKGSDDAYLCKFDNLGNLLWGTYYGGTKTDYGRSVITDKTGNTFISGVTRSPNLPVIGPDNALLDSISSNSPVEVDAFIAKFDPAGALVWATYCGGPGYEEMIWGEHLDVDACNAVYLAFESSQGAPTFSACEGGYLDPASAGSYDQYLMRFSNGGALQWASYLGGAGPEDGSFLDVVNSGDLYITGSWDIGAGSATYTFVNPGGGAFFSTGNGVADAALARFSGRMIGAPAGFSYSTICIGQTPSMLPVSNASFIGGGLFSSSAGLPIDKFSGNITITGVAPGTYTVFYNYEACQCHASQQIVNISTCSGLSEHQNGGDWLRIFGNPNSGEFKVQGTHASDLILVNELGQTIRTVSLSANHDYQTTISGLAPGIYFLKAENMPSAQKIIVLK